MSRLPDPLAPVTVPEASPAEDDSGPKSVSPDPGASAEVPDPFDDADALDELAWAITTLAAHIAAADHRLLTLLADFDRRRGWELGGHRSCAQWLHVRTAMDPHTAREKVRVAQALTELPRISEAMSRGQLSFSQVRALTREATPECEEELLELARGTTVAELRRVLRRWRTLSRADEAALERELYRLRRFAVHPDDDGMYVVRGRVPAEVGAVLMRAIEAASDALFCAEAAEETTPKQRRADALGLLAERAMAAGFGGEPPENVPYGTSGRSDAPMGGGEYEEERGSAESGSAEPDGEAKNGRTRPGAGRNERAEPLSPFARIESRSRIESLSNARSGASGEGCSGQEDGVQETGAGVAQTGSSTAGPGPAEPAGEPRDVPCGTPGRSDAPTGGESPGSGAAPSVPLSGTRAERYQVMIHVKADGSHLEDGTRLFGETSRRLCCDSSVVTVYRDPDGSVLDVGRRTRTVPPALRRALEVRDNGCRFPGCGLRFTDGHHLTHWSEGGETNLDNLILLCRYHHRLVHEGGWRVEFWGRERHAAFIDPRGGIHIDTERPTPELPDRPAEALAREQEARGVEPDGWELAADHQRAADVPWPLRARALEALDAARFGG